MARVIAVEKLTMRKLITDFNLYMGITSGLAELPLPEKLTIAGDEYAIPKTADELAKNICYGQRLFMVRKEENDFGLILRVIEGYYYTQFIHSEWRNFALYKGKKKWDEDLALLFGKIVLTCKAIELYPVSIHLSNLISQMIEKEHKLLHREPSKQELAAGIEKLNVFSELTSLDFLRDAMKITVPEVLLTPYNECLVRFMIAKETSAFQERYFNLLKEVPETKSKYAKSE